MSNTSATSPSLQSPILVTGGGGFLGGAIVRQLLEAGMTVRTFSRSRYEWLQRAGVEQLAGDLGDSEAVRAACQGCRLVFHVAAKAGIWGSFKDFHAANVIGTRNVLDACRSLGISELVYTSSPSVIFDGHDQEGVDESIAYPDRYRAHYPATKAEAERLVLAANGPKLSVVALRPHLIWGPRDTHIIPGLIARARSGALRRIGRADKLVDFTYVDNAAHAHILAARRLAPGAGIAGKAYFITDDNPMPLWSFVNRVLETAGLPPAQGSVPPRLAYAAGALLEVLYRALRLRGEPRITRFLVEELSTAHWYDIGAARRDLGYQPPVQFEEGMKRLGEWLRTL